MARRAMRRIVLCLLTLSVVSISASRAQVNAGPVIDNERVTVWDLAGPQAAGIDSAAKVAESSDTLAVYLAPNAIQGKVEFVPRGNALREMLRRSGASRMAVIALKNGIAVAPPNTSGLPEAFPRPRSKKVLDNFRVIVWDYTFEAGEPSPMHFHSRDVVTIYLKDGALVSTTPAGVKTDNEFTYGTIRFNPSNRMHSETLVKGESRIIATELK